MVGVDNTTLVTFRFKCQPHVCSVQILGSWDNFDRTYSLRRDARVGPEHWSGCHVYENIICDGSLSGRERPRHGGLKMGGTYWYYYVLDGNFETFDESQPTTSTCPLLPGQTVNVLEVPFEQCDAPIRRASVGAVEAISDVHTLKPTDRYQHPRPKTNPKLSRLSTSPSKLQEGSVVNEGNMTNLATHANGLSPTASANEAPPAVTQASNGDPSKASNFQGSPIAARLAGFDFNDFQLQDHETDHTSNCFTQVPEEYSHNEPKMRPRTEDQRGLLLPATIAHKFSCQSLRPYTAPATFSLSGSHSVSNVLHEQRDNESLRCKIHSSWDSPTIEKNSFGHVVNTPFNLPRTTLVKSFDEFEKDSEVTSHLRNEQNGSCAFGNEHIEHSAEDEDPHLNGYRLRWWMRGLNKRSYSDQESIHKSESAFQSSQNEHSRLETSSHFRVPESSNLEHSGLDLIYSPTCGSLTEDVSDESLVASSANSDIWNPQSHGPVRTYSPSLNFELDRPISSSSGRVQAPTNEDPGLFHGYSLPVEAGESQLTLTKTITPKATPHLTSDSRDGSISREALKDSMPSLPVLPKMDSLLDDLSYLGDAIS